MRGEPPSFAVVNGLAWSVDSADTFADAPVSVFDLQKRCERRHAAIVEA
jgi:hypothetical protein